MNIKNKKISVKKRHLKIKKQVYFIIMIIIQN